MSKSLVYVYFARQLIGHLTYQVKRNISKKLAIVQTKWTKRRNKQILLIFLKTKFFYTDHKYDRPTTSEHELVHLFCSSKLLCTVNWLT